MKYEVTFKPKSVFMSEEKLEPQTFDADNVHLNPGPQCYILTKSLPPIKNSEGVEVPQNSVVAIFPADVVFSIIEK